MNARTRAILFAGLLIFVAGGAGAAYLLGTRGGSETDTASTKVEVLYAAGPVDAGTSGATALAEGRISTQEIDPSAMPVGAVGDPAQISAQVATAPIAEGGIVTVDMFADPQTRIGTVLIPPGHRALALELQPVPGVAGFVGAGDRIDVYGVGSGEGATPEVRLVLQSVEVLNVNGAGLPAAQGQTGGPNLVYLVAVTPADAERLIFLTEFRKLYFDLVPKGEAPVTTPGAGPDTALQPAA